MSIFTSLATKYRPQSLDDVIGQDTSIKILKRQYESGTIKHAMLFIGPAGTGKTTTARDYADLLNGAKNSYIEKDAASNNSVDDVREIIETANERSISYKYKIYIIDECHMLTTQAWNAMLKLIEEPPAFTIFMFCTTDPQKIPQTIMNRCQIFRLNRVADNLIQARLAYICSNEQIGFTDDALNYITKMARGSMRQAITYLDKCKDFSDYVDVNVVKSVLGDCSYDTMFSLTDAVVDGDRTKLFGILDGLYEKGTDLKLFISEYLEFVLQLVKYCELGMIDCTSIPAAYEAKLRFTVGIENSVQWFSTYVDKVLKIKQAIKNDSDVLTTIEVMLTSKTM